MSVSIVEMLTNARTKGYAQSWRAGAEMVGRKGTTRKSITKEDYKILVKDMKKKGIDVYQHGTVECIVCRFGDNHFISITQKR